MTRRGVPPTKSTNPYPTLAKIDANQHVTTTQDNDDIPANTPESDKKKTRKFVRHHNRIHDITATAVPPPRLQRLSSSPPLLTSLPLLVSCPPRSRMAIAWTVCSPGRLAVHVSHPHRLARRGTARSLLLTADSSLH